MRAPRVPADRSRKVAALLAIAWGVSAAILPVVTGAPAAGDKPAAGKPTTAGKPAAVTRADLDAARRRAALLEAEHALARTRKPYVVIDLPARTLRYRMMGLDLRDVPCSDIEIKGLHLAGGVSEPRLLAGVFSLKEKEDDPRLDPLTPEEIESGLDDENTPNALPPEPPADFRLWFEEPVVARVTGADGAGGASSWLSRLWKAIRGDGRSPRGGPALQIRIDLEEKGLAPEIYRSLIPGSRFVVVPPAGWVLPDAGQPAPAKLRPGKPQAKPQPQPSPEAGVPFRLPPPEAVPDATPAAPQAPGDAPPKPPAPPGTGEPPEAEPTPEEGTGDPDLPEDWVPAEEEPPAGEEPPAR